MSAVLLFILAGVMPLLVPVLAGCILHDIRWSRQCAASNARWRTERAQQEAEAAWQAERAAAIAAIAERNYAEARRGGSHFIFEGIPAKYR